VLRSRLAGWRWHARGLVVRKLAVQELAGQQATAQRVHATAVARDGEGILLLGASGAGKSDLALRLIDRGWRLVSDDQVLVRHGVARPVPELAGLIEIRGLGLVHLPFLSEAPLRLAVLLCDPAAVPERMPSPSRHDGLGLPQIGVVAAAPSAPIVIERALDCALGRLRQAVGAFAA
jgi:HPr kinase/phosphorylase